ncbi:M14 family zinc carboxypeptidase [Amycolatopsis cihanbeyliensis]|uniref:Zinc carboxypeptidase n=1 Tax=Amycolatopsis cihanbeyliensis TaxID=1128664 RepID=A0A542DD11_AMYCI|nr:M14 family zinc carboxypeptidase [Amycolatopsis cihanbeyliensis]TQJ00946.1 PKD domain-containing protein [Amycolatopsis cihanbeyliensis]
MLRRLLPLAMGLALLAPPAVALAETQQDEPAPADAGVYLVQGADTRDERTSVVRTGAAIDEIGADHVLVSALPGEVAAIRDLGFAVTRQARAMDFPPSDSGYHNYDELRTELDRIAGEHPDLVELGSIGESYEGRELPVMKISDNVATDEDEPEVLFTANQHAREHLTAEMALYLANLLTDSHGTDSQITRLVNQREVWIIPMANPDGVEYDVATGQYRSWRKNREPNGGSTGTDLNRNWDYKWGCCGGSSGNPASNTYRGPSAESSPEVSAIADFVRGRVVGGEQQITAHIDFHTYGELVLWPMGYTYDDTGPDMPRDAHDTFVEIGREMAATNNYTPQQSSDLYITDGSVNDWMWAVQDIFSYTFEMYPRGSNPGFYPPDEVIDRETSRNREAALSLIDYADCPYRAIGKQDQYCGSDEPGAPTAEFTAQCAEAEPSCTFDASASRDSEGTIESFEWNFGDGETGTGVRPEHTYPQPGEYTVTLTVTDDEGNTDEATRTVTAGTPPDTGEPPAAAFTVDCYYDECSFDASGSTDPDRDIESYTWDFGDGRSGAGTGPSHRYPPESASYTVELTVTDAAGHSDTATRPVQCWNFGSRAFCFAG